MHAETARTYDSFPHHRKPEWRGELSRASIRLRSSAYFCGCFMAPARRALRHGERSVSIRPSLRSGQAPFRGLFEQAKGRGPRPAAHDPVPPMLLAIALGGALGSVA